METFFIIFILVALVVMLRYGSYKKRYSQIMDEIFKATGQRPDWHTQEIMKQFDITKKDEDIGTKIFKFYFAMTIASIINIQVEINRLRKNASHNLSINFEEVSKLRAKGREFKNEAEDLIDREIERFRLEMEEEKKRDVPENEKYAERCFLI